MSHLVLSLSTEEGAFLLLDSTKQHIISQQHWTESEGRNQGHILQIKLLELLQTAQTNPKNIQKILCVSGPGSFTSLRIAGSFCLGLKSALQVPLIGVPSYDLMGKAFYLPLRPRKCKDLSLKECREQDLKFLHLKSPHSFEIKKLPTQIKKEPIVGIKDSPKFPSIQQVHHAAQLNAESETPFQINYGFDPQFVKSPKM